MHRNRGTRLQFGFPNSHKKKKNTSKMKKFRNFSQLKQQNSRKAVKNETDLYNSKDF